MTQNRLLVNYSPLVPSIPSLRQAIHVVLGIAFLTLLAKIRFEIGPVPITGQTLGVLLIAASYGWRLGTLTNVSYLALAGFGLPVLARAEAGWTVFQGSTGGYLIGFAFASLLVGYLADRGWDKKIYTNVMAMILGNIVIYAFGLYWLHQFAPDWQTTLAWGLTPFLVGDAIKIALAALLLPLVWNLLECNKSE